MHLQPLAAEMDALAAVVAQVAQHGVGVGAGQGGLLVPQPLLRRAHGGGVARARPESGLRDHERKIPAGLRAECADDVAQSGRVNLLRHAAGIALALVPQHRAEAARAEFAQAGQRPVEQLAAGLPLVDAGAAMAGDRHPHRHVVLGVYGVAEGRPETAEGVLPLIVRTRLRILGDAPGRPVKGGHHAGNRLGAAIERVV